MALFIRDDAVDALAEEYKHAIKAPSKKAAVKLALQDALERVRQKRPLMEQLEDVWKLVDEIGERDPNFDFKKFREELWGDD